MATGDDPVQRLLAGDAASRSLGLRLIDYGDGHAHMRMTVTAAMVNGHGMAHGGAIFSLADTAFAIACNSWGPPAVAAGAEIVFVKAAMVGDVLDATARVRTRFARHGIYDVTVRRSDEVIAEFRGRSQELRGR